MGRKENWRETDKDTKNRLNFCLKRKGPENYFRVSEHHHYLEKRKKIKDTKVMQDIFENSSMARTSGFS